jgi:hypothetical protein
MTIDGSGKYTLVCIAKFEVKWSPYICEKLSNKLEFWAYKPEFFSVINVEYSLLDIF